MSGTQKAKVMSELKQNTGNLKQCVKKYQVGYHQYDIDICTTALEL